VYGRGEFMTPLDILTLATHNNSYTVNRIVNAIIEKYYLLVYPKIPIQTAIAYQHLNREIDARIIAHNSHSDLIQNYTSQLEINN